MIHKYHNGKSPYQYELLKILHEMYIFYLQVFLLKVRFDILGQSDVSRVVDEINHIRFGSLSARAEVPVVRLPVLAVQGL